MILIVRKLRQPFFKIEDKSRQYRPIIYETNNWPSPNPNCTFKQSPFDVNCLKDVDQDSAGVNSNSDAEGDNIGEDDALYEDEKRPGFCEPCSVRYEDLKTVSVLLMYCMIHVHIDSFDFSLESALFSIQVFAIAI